MSYAAGVALQGAVYQHLRADTALAALVGDAIFDAMPVDAPSGVFVSLGPEETRDAGDMTASGSQHDFIVSVLSGADDSAGDGGGCQRGAGKRRDVAGTRASGGIVVPARQGAAGGKRGCAAGRSDVPRAH